MTTEVHVAFLWHMHQPWYALPGSGTNLLPWTRLRATKDYTDMARFVEQGEAPVTVNFAPSLTEQLRRYAEGSLTDRYLPPAASEEAFQDLVSGAVPLPLARRGFPAPDLGKLRKEAGTPDGARDLWAWFFLAWTAQTALDEDPTLRELARTSHFTNEDLALLEGIHHRLLSEVLPHYRRLAQDGLIELSATPFYHPILPLLVDSAAARRAQPADRIPAFSAPEDSREQVKRALIHHETTFGSKPQGMWPAEGAVSPEAVEVFGQAGVSWIATDGAILARSLDRPPTPDELYRPWRFRVGSGEVTVLFRDTDLSNLLSFQYHAWRVEDAVGDLVRRFREIGQTWGKTEPPLVLIAMDGENAWDFYDRNGRPFFEALYRALRSTPGIVPTTVSGYLSRFGAGEFLPGLWSGSWIDADFRTWIGHPAQNRAWERLAAAREAVAACPDPGSRKRAQEHLYVAEGSDWFWWYGPHHSAAHEPVFDRLFRAHLAQAYREIGHPVPQNLTG
ncbi:MAG: glycoside hydrolase family 57 protein [Candidatus Bipolaricaulota bacterium]